MALQRFPVLRRRLDAVIGQFLHDGVRPAGIMIENLIEMELDYINSSHPNFIGGNKAVELAMQEMKSLQDSAEAERVPITEIGQRSRTVLPKAVVNGVLPNQGNRSQSINQKAVSNVGGSLSSRSWGIYSIFGSKAQSGESPASKILKETHNVEQLPSVIQLKEPPSILRPLEMTENDEVEIIATKLMLRSYHDIVRKNIQDLVPKAIMHFLVNHTKRNLHNTFIRKLYRENHIEELLEEEEEVVTNRKRALEVFSVLQKAVQTLDQVESDVSTANSTSNSGLDTAGSSRILGSSPFPQSRTNSESRSTYESLPNPKARRLFYSEEQSIPRNSNGRI